MLRERNGGREKDKKRASYELGWLKAEKKAL